MFTQKGQAGDDGTQVRLRMTNRRRQLAATLGRIYPYRAAKQQAPGVAATDAKGFPNRPGITGIPEQAGNDDVKPERITPAAVWG